MDEARPPATQLLSAPACVVAQQFTGGRDRCRCPGRRHGGGRVGGQVEQRPEGGQRGTAVGHDVMHSQERANMSLWQPGE